LHHVLTMLSMTNQAWRSELHRLSFSTELLDLSSGGSVKITALANSQRSSLVG